MSDRGRETFGYATLANMTGLSTRQLKRLVAAKKIPHIRYSERVVRFSGLEIEAWIRERHVQPEAPAPQAKG